MHTNDFTSLSLHPRILSGVDKLGYKTLTPIQKKSIPAVLEGQDVMGLAQTGTGKTAAFVLPILQRLMEGPRGQIRALILAPTRELAQQIYEDINNLGSDTGLRSTTLYGGVNINPQFRQLRRGVEIVVACPGRLLDHITQRTIDLQHLEVLVLDEADQMFDMGFLPNIRRILQHLPKKRQSLLFSATMPQEVRQLAEDILVKPAIIQVQRPAPANTVKQAVFPVSDHLKTLLLIEILKSHDTGSVLIFTRTKHRAKSVAEQLEAVGYFASSLQGNLSQAKRQKVLNDFRAGKLPILVATDIASRGIDIAKISHVINYDMPATIEAYTHRIGRTGRAEKLGDAFTLVTSGDMGRVRAIERVLNAKLEQRKIPDFDYSAKTPRTHGHKEKHEGQERSRSHPRDRDFSHSSERFARSEKGDRRDRSDRNDRSARPKQRYHSENEFRSRQGQRERARKPRMSNERQDTKAGSSGRGYREGNKPRGRFNNAAPDQQNRFRSGSEGKRSGEKEGRSFSSRRGQKFDSGYAGRGQRSDSDFARRGQKSDSGFAKTSAEHRGSRHASRESRSERDFSAKRSSASQPGHRFKSAGARQDRTHKKPNGPPRTGKSQGAGLGRKFRRKD